MAPIRDIAASSPSTLNCKLLWSPLPLGDAFLQWASQIWMSETTDQTSSVLCICVQNIYWFPKVGIGSVYGTLLPPQKELFWTSSPWVFGDGTSNFSGHCLIVIGYLKMEQKGKYTIRFLPLSLPGASSFANQWLDPILEGLVYVGAVSTGPVNQRL